MTNLNAANKQRQEAALDKKWNFADYGVTTFRALIEAGKLERPETAEVPKINFNRRRFNRMDAAEQLHYEQRLSETKREYRLYHKGRDVFVICPKLVHDWALVRISTANPKPETVCGGGYSR